MNEKLEAVRKTLTHEENEALDEYIAFFPDEDPELLAAAAKVLAASRNLSAGLGDKTREAYGSADKSELCFYKYSDAHPGLDSDTKKKLIRAFFACGDPEKLMELTPEEILK